MNILYFVRTFNERTATFIYNEIANMSAYAKVRVICNKRINEAIYPMPATELSGSLVHRVWNYGRWRAGVAARFRDPHFRRDLFTEIHQYNTDLIHCHFGLDALLVFQNMDVFDIPMIVSFHGYDASQLLHKRTYRRQVKRMLGHPNVTAVFPSNDMANRVWRAVQPDDMRSEVIPYGVDTDFFKPTDRTKSDCFTFLQVGAFREKKGQLYTVRAFYRMIKNYPKVKARLVFIGDGPTREAIQKEVKFLGLEEVILFRGHKPPMEVLEALNNADAFCHHSITAKNGDMEGMPNAIMEAMAMELPILSTEHAGIPELVRDPQDGFLCKEKDIEMYATQMYVCLNRVRLAATRSRIVTKFSNHAHTRALIALYSSEINKTYNGFGDKQ